MIDELVLERIFTETAEEIPVPENGAERVVAELSATVARAPRRPSASAVGWLAAAAAAVVLLLAVGLTSHGTSGGAKSSSAVLASPSVAGDQTNALKRKASAGYAAVGGGASPIAAGRTVVHGAPSVQERPSAPPSSASGGTSTSSAPVDGAKIVKTGTLDLQVPHATLPTAVNRVTGVAIGLGRLRRPTARARSAKVTRPPRSRSEFP